VVNIGQKLSPEELAFFLGIFPEIWDFWCVLFGNSRKPGRLHMLYVCEVGQNVNIVADAMVMYRIGDY